MHFGLLGATKCYTKEKDDGEMELENWRYKRGKGDGCCEIKFQSISFCLQR